MPHLVLLTGPRAAGKTTICDRLLRRAREAGLRVGGTLPPCRYDASGTKTGIDVVDVFSGESRALAESEPRAHLRTVGQFRFDAPALNWALDRILQALEAPIDLAVIDEVGRLELVEKDGFAPALELLPSAQAATVVLVVRAGLHARAQQELRDLGPISVMLTPANRDRVLDRLFEEIRSQVPAARQE